MRIFHFILVIFCGLVASCGSADTCFPREETLTQELMPLQGVTYPVRVEVKHPFLIVQNMKRADSLFHIYDLTNYELKSVFGVMGQGPNEYVAPWLFHTQLPDILIGDVDKNFVYRFGINEEGLPVFRDAIQLGYLDYGVADAAFINDSLYVMDAKHIAPSLYLLTLQDELPKKTRQYRNPDLINYNYYADPDIGKAYANESRIALCYEYKKQIDFMDTDLNLIKRVKFDFAHPANIDGPDVKVSYVYGYFGKRYLYALFFGTSWNEHRANSLRGTFLEVFDLDGNPVVRYRLDGLRPVYFAVDEETFTLYGAGDDGEPEDYLVVYKLNGLF